MEDNRFYEDIEVEELEGYLDWLAEQEWRNQPMEELREF